MKHKNVSTFRRHFRIPYAGVVEMTKKNFFLLFKVQQTFELETVEINSSNGVGFFRWRRPRKFVFIQFPILCFVKLLNLETCTALGDGQVERNMQHMT